MKITLEEVQRCKRQLKDSLHENVSVFVWNVDENDTAFTQWGQQSDLVENYVVHMPGF